MAIRLFSEIVRDFVQWLITFDIVCPASETLSSKQNTRAPDSNRLLRKLEGSSKIRVPLPRHAAGMGGHRTKLNFINPHGGGDVVTIFTVDLKARLLSRLARGCLALELCPLGESLGRSALRAEQ